MQRVRTIQHKDENESMFTQGEGSSLYYNHGVGQDMICKMCQDDLSVSSWNLWDGMAVFESTDHGSEGESAHVMNENLEKNVGRICEHGQRLEFRPVFVPSLSRPSSRIGSRLPILQRPLAPVEKDSLADSVLPESKDGGMQRRQVQYPVRSVSPTNRFDFTAGSMSQRIRTSPARDTSEIAAACFAVGDDEQRVTRLEPFDVRLTDIVSVQSDGGSHGNSNVGFILISTRNCGSLEIVPDSRHARDLLLAFLQATLPKGIMEDHGTLLDSKVLLSKHSSQSFDMQDFEENAVKKTFANETFWDRVARRSATFAVRFKESKCSNGYIIPLNVSVCFVCFKFSYIPNRCLVYNQCVYVVIMKLT